LTKAQAQQRVDQVAAFRRELVELDREGVLRLAPDDRARVNAYHEALLEPLAARYDVDRTDRQRRMSLGMRIASLLGAVTLSAAVVLFFYRVWGLLTTPAQLGVLALAPLVVLGATDAAARREKALYVALILAVTATAAFILNVNGVGLIFNMRPSPYALALWATFAFIVAYTYGLRLLLAAGITLAMAFVCAWVATWAGLDMNVFPARPEPLLPAGALAIAIASLAPNRRRAGFPETWRLVGWFALLVPLIFLSTWSRVFSYLPWPEQVVGAIYDVAGFALAITGIVVGLRAGWREVSQLATGFLVVFFTVKYFDWWWDWLPRYLFFLLLGGIAVAVLVVLSRIRARQREA
jgi:uncharacterized membrane protein